MLIKKSHDAYVNDVLCGLTPGDNGSSSSQKAWSYLKSLQSRSTGVPHLVYNSKICTSDCSKVEALCEQFDTAFANEDLLSIPSLGASPHTSMPDIPISV